MELLRVQTADPDVLARNLAYAGALARSMPPAWKGAHISHVSSGPGGEYMGRLLPGKGLYLEFDPKELGMTHFPRHVFARSPVKRLIDGLVGFGLPLGWAEQGAITPYDGIISARAGGKAFDITWSKTSITTVANTYSTLYRAGGLPVAGTYTNIPGGAAHTRASTGAWSTGLIDPTNPDKKYMLTLGFTHASALNMLILIDLLVAAGNILATTASAQTVNSTALTRYTTGAGVVLTFDITTALSATAHNMTVNSYTNQAGTAAQTTGAQTGLSGGIVMRLVPVGLGPFMQLATGDYGVRSVEQYTNSVDLAARGVGLHLYFPISFIPGIGANVYMERGSTVSVDGLTELVQTAGGVLGCLAAYAFCNTTSSGIGTYFLRTCNG